MRHHFFSHRGRDRDSLHHAVLHAIGRHHHHGRRHGHGSPNAQDPGGFDGEGLPRGRKFSSNDLQLMLLALLADAPSHGYELIKALEARSNGFYSPSPGMVYPALTFLEDLGYVTAEAEGNRKRYALSDSGHTHLKANREIVDRMLERISQIAQRMDSVRRAFSGGDASEGPEASASSELTSARNDLRSALKQALNVPGGATLKVQRRIADILIAAAREIGSLED